MKILFQSSLSVILYFSYSISFMNEFTIGKCLNLLKRLFVISFVSSTLTKCISCSQTILRTVQTLWKASNNHNSKKSFFKISAFSYGIREGRD